ncbi:hypothetical protein SAMN05216201_11176 [Pseudomonas linyingensis]|uniref:Uncharacterized protein n=1 Tax=Pseudomonas linyingensis TaxID=915471 RepID=A0A1H7A0T7_9PSED|nr:hypothetical protein [Pseudomonas linyingensis]SEJ58044.1 hypothetical protein SAMN05216201_11176 [Pseudomonas linyingensis]
MTLTAYWLGQSIVAAATPEEVVAVMERHEPPGRWLTEQARELTVDELAEPLDAGSVADALAATRSAQLLRWDYPQQ